MGDAGRLELRLLDDVLTCEIVDIGADSAQGIHPWRRVLAAPHASE